MHGKLDRVRFFWGTISGLRPDEIRSADDIPACGGDEILAARGLRPRQH